MSKKKLTVTILQEDPLILSIKKNGRAVSEAVAKMYLKKHYPDKKFNFFQGHIVGGHRMEVEEIK